MSHSSSPSSWSLDEVASVEDENEADSLPDSDFDDGDLPYLAGEGSGDPTIDEFVEALRGEKAEEDAMALGRDPLRE